jgi:uncharacterized protein YciI
MATFVLLCTDKPNALELRMATREAHLTYVRANAGLVKLAGPMSDENGDMAGSMFILDVEDLAAAKAFSAADPYAQAGLFDLVVVKAFRATIGGLA